MLKTGIYEQLITALIKNQLDSVSSDNIIQKTTIGEYEIPRILTLYLSELIRDSLENEMVAGKGINGQIDMASKILKVIEKGKEYAPYIHSDHEKKLEKLLAIVDKKENHNIRNNIIKIERPITSIS